MTTISTIQIHGTVLVEDVKSGASSPAPSLHSTIAEDVPDFALEEGKQREEPENDVIGAIELHEVAATPPLDVIPPVTFKKLTVKDRTNSFLSLFKMSIKEVAGYLTFIVAGWSDATSGVLIPYMERYFGIGYMAVSCLFVGQFLGFFLASLTSTYLMDRLGLGKVIVLGAVSQMAAYLFMFPPINFPVLASAYILSGFGLALQNASTSSFIAGLPDVAWKMGLLHSFYGLGGVISPLVATAFVSSGIKFSYFYLITLGVCAMNVALLVHAFRLKPEPLPANYVHERPGDQLKKILVNKNVWFISLFIIVYVGAEVSMGGWIVSFIIRQRGGGAGSGYIATGFFSGLALGRLLCPRFNTYVGEKRVVYLYLGVGAALQFIIWFVPSIEGNAVAVGLVGFVLGPLYPNAMSLTVKIFPRSLHHGCIGFMNSLGQSGAAIFPFITGVLAQKYSVNVLPPVELALFATMTVLWSFVPNPERRSE
ncbi:MFS general substrate transporter, partial [Atractiella rhizophila]